MFIPKESARATLDLFCFNTCFGFEIVRLERYKYLEEASVDNNLSCGVCDARRLLTGIKYIKHHVTLNNHIIRKA